MDRQGSSCPWMAAGAIRSLWTFPSSPKRAPSPVIGSISTWRPGTSFTCRRLCAGRTVYTVTRPQPMPHGGAATGFLRWAWRWRWRTFLRTTPIMPRCLRSSGNTCSGCPNSRTRTACSARSSTIRARTPNIPARRWLPRPWCAASVWGGLRPPSTNRSSIAPGRPFRRAPRPTAGCSMLRKAPELAVSP